MRATKAILELNVININSFQQKKENKIRRGEVSYADREWKFIY